MSRPRIRTLKPENWQDEAVGMVAREARLLRDVLITFADDDGRWRHLPAAIIGHGYPYDDDVTPAKIKKWATDLAAVGIIVLYLADGGEYGCFPTWHVHQNINRYTPSTLPECPDERVVSRTEASLLKRVARTEDAPTTHAPLTENSVSKQGAVSEGASPRAQARGSGSLPDPAPDPDVDAQARELAATVDGVIGVLRQQDRLHIDRVGVENSIAAYPAARDFDAMAAAREVVAWVSDPAFRKTNAASLMMDAFRKQDRGNGNRASAARPAGGWSAEDYLRAGEAAA